MAAKYQTLRKGCHCRQALSMTSHINLAMIIWQTLSGARNVLIAQKFTNILIVIVAGKLITMQYISASGISTCYLHAVFGLLMHWKLS